LRDRFETLNKREQWALKLGALAVACFIVIQFFLFPLGDKVRRLESSVGTKEKDLSELKAVVARYQRLPKPDALREGREEPFSLFSTLEKQAAKSDLMPKVEYMRPGALQLDVNREEKWVEIKLNRITLKEMASILHSLESVGRGVYIKRLSARKEGEYLTLIFQPAIVETKQPAPRAGG